MKPFVAMSLFVLSTAGGASALAETPTCFADRAEVAYRSGDYAAAADLFEGAARCGTGDPYLYYSSACAEALAGRRDAAFAALFEAVTQGFADADLLASDADLASLRDDPRWSRVVAEVEQGKRRSEAVWGGAAFATPYREDLPADEKVAGLSRIWAEARSSFAYFDLVPELDWDAAYLEWMPRVRATRSTAEYYRELEALVAKLRDGHSNVRPPQELRAAFSSRPSLETEWLEGHVLVTDVLDPELAAKGLVRGLELVAIDGEPVATHAEKSVRPYQSASTPQDLEIRVYREGLLRGAEGTRVRLLLVDAAGARLEVELERLSPERLRELAPAAGVFEATPLADGLLRIGLRSFNSEEVVARWREHWQEIAAARGLVLDLRENGGGNSLNGWAILATLVDRPFATSAWSTRLYGASFRAWGRGESWYRGGAGLVQPDPDLRFAGPVALLIGPRTYSAAEDFTVAFDAAARGQLVGEATGGSTGQPLVVALPGGGTARFCTKRDTYPDGREFVGRGIQPTQAVPRTVADLRAGRDAALEVAVASLRAELGAASAPR